MDDVKENIAEDDKDKEDKVDVGKIKKERKISCMNWKEKKKKESKAY